MLLFVVFGWQKLTGYSGTIAYFGQSGVPLPSLAAPIAVIMELGVGIAIVLAIIEFLWDGWRPHSAVLGRVEGVKGYHDIARHPDARLIPGLRSGTRPAAVCVRMLVAG